MDPASQGFFFLAQTVEARALKTSTIFMMWASSVLEMALNYHHHALLYIIFCPQPLPSLSLVACQHGRNDIS